MSPEQATEPTTAFDLISRGCAVRMTDAEWEAWCAELDRNMAEYAEALAEDRDHAA